MAAAPQFSTDRFALKLGLFYAAYFFFGGVQLPFFPLWLEAQGPRCAHHRPGDRGADAGANRRDADHHPCRPTGTGR